ncbi:MULTISPECIES: hypothetical protein [Emticicia]|uniref:hypothetical protein n=1 Tax=Emticicia TaxID=312278 RepID=UPI0020A02E34|nr:MULTISPECIES: hypothetical protein [Emticicia]UTA67597.1 hypothetical protein MB380_18645 [Emticicia sp. 21SJ11W-3]
MIFKIQISTDFDNHLEKSFTYSRELLTFDLHTVPIVKSTLDSDTTLSNYPEYVSYNHTLEGQRPYQYS